MQNIDPLILDKAKKQTRDQWAKTNMDRNTRFIVIPPGDSRNDDPPFNL